MRPPRDVVWHDEAPTGKLDLLLTLDFRMTSTTMFSDVVLPAATWYEKHDLTTTDMHPFVHSFNPAIAPPWQTRTDFDAFTTIAQSFSRLAEKHLGVRKDVVAVPLLHDTPDEMANPHGRVRDWKAGDCEPIPGKTMPKLVVVERDYGAVAEKMAALGPLLDTLGATTKGVTFQVDKEIDYLRHKNGAVRGGVGRRPAVDRPRRPGLRGDPRAVRHHQRPPRRPGLPDPGEAHRPAPGRPGRRARGQADHLRRHPGPAGPGDHLTGVVRLGAGGRRYSPFTINVERLKPWHTLTGRQHFFLDHDWMAELGEGLPVFRPPLNMQPCSASRRSATTASWGSPCAT